MFEWSYYMSYLARRIVMYAASKSAATPTKPPVTQVSALVAEENSAAATASVMTAK